MVLYICKLVDANSKRGTAVRTVCLSGRYIDFAVLSQERVELTLVSHNNFPRNGSKFLENTTVFPA